ncbi:Nitrogen assimilation transcription factor nirA [Apiospora arundinis]|uniref:Nitrogen assimilation transcription factor nirA n=1 Tax=Apiospora arundinis TaxID=335852 RepID=A0ABR2IXF4_9PEZI
MSATWRNIEPKPIDFIQPQIEAAKKTKVKIACRQCRTKRKKCDGGRPSCGVCKTDCVYDEKDGEALRRSLQQENKQLQYENTQLQHGYEQLEYRVQRIESLLGPLFTAQGQTILGMPFKHQPMESMAQGHFYGGQWPGPAAEQQPATPSHCLTGLSSAQPDPGLVASDARGEAPAPMPFDMNLLRDFGQGMVGEVLTGQALLQHFPDSEPP